MNKNNKHTKSKQAKTSGQFNTMPWVAGAVFVLGLSVLAGLYWDDNMSIRNVRFEGLMFIDQSKLEEQVQIPIGIKSDSLDFMKIINRIEKIPYVRKAQINVEPSGNLLVQITERKPIALLADGKEKIYIDSEGIRLHQVLGNAVDVPVLYGFKAQPLGDTLKSDAFKAVRDFLLEMQKKPVSDATISEVAWTTKEGIVALTNEYGVKLIFGKNDFKNRLRNWEAFYGEIIKSKGITSLRTVDLRFQGQIVTRKQ